MKHPKFIIEQFPTEKRFICGMVEFHRDLAKQTRNVLGGGWYLINHNDKSITLYGESMDFGKYSDKDVEECLTNGIFQFPFDLDVADFAEYNIFLTQDGGHLKLISKTK